MLTGNKVTVFCPLTCRMSGPEMQTLYGLFCSAPFTDHIVLNYSKSLLLAIMDPGYRAIGCHDIFMSPTQVRLTSSS